jgi:methyl-accepting chemotaxis protein
MSNQDQNKVMGLQSQDFVVLAASLTVYAGTLAYGVVYGDLALSAVLGALMLGASWLAAKASQGGQLSQLALPFLGMALVGLLIHTAHGHNEAHFAVFAFLACVVAYRSALPIIVAAVTIAVHHVSFNQFQTWGWGPLCFTEPGWAKVVEHALYVVAESVVLLLMAARAKASFGTAEELMTLVDGLRREDGSIDLMAAHERSNDPKVQRFIDAMQHIAQSIHVVRETATTLHAAASEIAAGNQSLSARTEEAAASIQQTAASMEEIASSIQSSSGNAHNANQLAHKASTVAAEGGEAVGRMVNTMAGIQQSSRKITDIIGVIDGIAFQTNILALNAAVEAARAGEQGRGFAVVAAEVRMLARRSADAAKEIKQLISSSVEQVEGGSALINTTGGTISEVVDQVRRVNELVSLIATTSSEQSNGIAQVNTSIGRLDHATQHNAALVEQTSAAAESLRQQADKLTQVMQVFHLARA